MLCPYCGNEIPDGSSSCGYCGNDLTGVMGQQMQGQAQNYGQQMQGQAQNYGQQMQGQAQNYGQQMQGQAQNYGQQMQGQAQSYGQQMQGQAQNYGQQMQNMSQQNRSVQPGGNPPQKKNKTGLIVGLSIGAVVLIAAALLIFVFDVFHLFDKDDEDKQTTTQAAVSTESTQQQTTAAELTTEATTAATTTEAAKTEATTEATTAATTEATTAATTEATTAAAATEASTEQGADDPRLQGTFQSISTPLDVEGGTVYEDIFLTFGADTFSLVYTNVVYNGETYPDLKESIEGTYKVNGDRVTFYKDGAEFDNADFADDGTALQFYDTTGAKAFKLTRE